MSNFNIIGSTVIILAVAGSNALASPSFFVTNETSVIDGSFFIAQTNTKKRRDGRQDNRGERRDDRQDCRQGEGAGKDKRDCKQDERQDRKKN